MPEDNVESEVGESEVEEQVDEQDSGTAEAVTDDTDKTTETEEKPVVEEKPVAAEPAVDPLDQLWQETMRLFSEPQPAEKKPESEQSEASEVEILRGELSKMKQVMLSMAKQQNARHLVEKYRREVDDWADIEADVLKFAAKFGDTASDEELMMLARAKKAGLNAPAAKKKEPERKATSPRAAASEKPTLSGAKAEREYGSLGEAAAESLRELKAKHGAR